MGKYNRTHRHGERGGGGNGGRRSKSLASLTDVTSVSSGKDLLRLARAMSRVEIQPQVRAYRRLARELKGQQATDTIGLNRLGQQTQADIQGAANAYDVGAQAATSRTQAVGSALQSQLAAQGQQAAASQQAAQTGALGGLQQQMSAAKAPQGGQAQAALASLVQQQASRRAAETQAGAQFASSQQGSYGGLLEGMRAAGALQASTSRQQVGRDIASRIAETRLQAGQDIREALGKKADAKALKGATMLEKLAQLRSEERDYDLGRRATAVDKRGQSLDAAAAAASLAQDQAQFEQGHQNDLELEAAGDRGENRGEDNQGSGNARDNRQEAARDQRDALGAARDLFQTGRHAGDVDWYRTNFAAYVDEIKSRSGVSYSTAREMARRLLRRQSAGGGGADAPPGNL